MEILRQKSFKGERAAFFLKDAKIVDSVFSDGESPLKHSKNIELENSAFKWKYPLWYSKNITMRNCTLFDMARAGIWYTEGIVIENCTVEAPKNLRRSKNITLKNVVFSNAEETLWTCERVSATNVTAKGDYFGMNCSDLDFDSLTLVGNYGFDGAKNLTVKNSRLLTKDAFWNSENVTVKDSYIAGEYLGWNSKNLTFENCVIESLQGLCFIDNLTMRNCKLIDTTLAFEYSNVDAEIDSKIDSVLNPSSGRITAQEIGVLTLEKDRIDPSKTVITVKK